MDPRLRSVRHTYLDQGIEIYSLTRTANIWRAIHSLCVLGVILACIGILIGEWVLPRPLWESARELLFLAVFLASILLPISYRVISRAERSIRKLEASRFNLYPEFTRKRP